MCIYSRAAGGGQTRTAAKRAQVSVTNWLTAGPLWTFDWLLSGAARVVFVNNDAMAAQSGPTCGIIFS